MTNERFTRKNSWGEYVANCGNCPLKECDVSVCRNHVLKRLGELEDKIEQGLLVELPCNVGDTVYWIQREDKGIEELEVKSIGVSINQEWKLTYLHCEFFTPTYEHLIGYRLFLTREEAETKLAELRGGK